MKMRKIEKLVDETWIVIPMKEMKEGDIFRMTEPGESTPSVVWRATGDAYELSIPSEEELVWGVDCIHV